MLNVSCDSSKEMELDRGFCTDVRVCCARDGFFNMAAGREQLGGVFDIGD